ncbi:HAMP domain-containing sensor histidine kinase [Streptomyces sp. NPDC050738]|uniref:sensor histidine kinase n=1 Tax=Streptomyces sp. NPDC050738 TaxID=3154744 RepID=UPI003443E734
MQDEYTDDLAALYAPDTPPLALRSRQAVIPLKLPCRAYEACAALLAALEHDEPDAYPQLAERDVHPLDSAALSAALKRFSDDPDLDRLDTLIVRIGAPGRLRRLILGITLYRDAPAPALLFARVFESTELHETRFRHAAEVTRLAELIDVLEDGVMLTDGRYRLRLMNSALVDLAHLQDVAPFERGTDVHRVERAMLRLLADPSDPRLQSVDRLVERCAPHSEPLKLADGRTVRRTYVPLFSGDTYIGNLWLFRDLTEQQNALGVLRERNQDLTQLADERARFTAAVSHDLRTPLTTISSFCELLATDEQSPLTEEQLRHLGVIEKSAARMLRIIRDLLVITSLENHALELELADVDVPGLCTTTVAEMEPLAAAAHLTLRCDAGAGPVLSADRYRLRQVLDNLLGNAIKFTPAGGEVSLSCRYEAARHQWVLTVADTGIGIPGDQQADIFDQFQRASNTGGHQGSGLGLSIARGLVERHGGTIALTSTVGMGTTVTVTLPLTPVEPGQR